MVRIDGGGQLVSRSILVVLPTWVGDFVMATPTLRAIRDRFADVRITFLMHPNLRDLVRGGDWMDECVEWPGGNAETQKRRNTETGKRPGTWWELSRTLRARRFDLAVLLPNSFRAAWIAWCSDAKRRIGYNRDGRGFLLTDRIPVPNRRRSEWSAKSLRKNQKQGFSEYSSGAKTPESDLWSRLLNVGFDFFSNSKRNLRSHDPYVPSCLRAFVPSIQMGTKLPVRLGRYVPMPLVEYYADLAEAVGCERPGDRLELFTTPDCDESIQNRLSALGVADRHPLIVISPGAKFGASKCWLPERFAAAADRLIESADAAVIVTCGPGEEPIVRSIGAAMKNNRKLGASPRPSPWKGEGAGGFVFDDPLLTLGELKSLIARSDLLICNDAGPRHLAKAFDVPVVTVFGPTHPDWTSTSYEKERIVRIDVDCGPCQQRFCPLGHHQCMTGVTVDMIFAAVSALLRNHATQHA